MMEHVYVQAHLQITARPYNKLSLHNSQFGGENAQFGKEQCNYITIHFNTSKPGGT